MGVDDEERTPERRIIPSTPPIRSLVVIRIGLAMWVVALVILWTAPSLSEGERSWWPWVPVAALVVGLIGHTYVMRGRGNAAQA
ncbi:MAG: DUF2530 domain-containing protein [Ornithinimicrobium sp.]